MKRIIEACPKLQQHMGAVAVGGVAGVLAAAKKGKLGPLSGEHQRLDAGPGMRPVAKGLLLASPAAAPGLALASLEFHLIGAELRPFRFGHALASHITEGG